MTQESKVASMKKRIAVYARVSTLHDDQKQSIEYQSTTIPKMVEDDPQAELYRVYIDRGVTGTSKEKRPDFLEMIEDAKKGKFDWIVSKNISRLARNVRDFVNITEDLKELDPPVGIYFLEGGMNTLDPLYAPILAFLATVAEMESKNTSDHIKEVFEAKQAKGIRLTNSAPYGYEMEIDKQGNRKLKIVPEEAKIVEKVFTWYDEGISTTKISKLLEDRGITKKASSICKMLHMKEYTGDLYSGKSTTKGVRGKRILRKEPLGKIENAHPQIISKELFDRVNEKMRGTGRGCHPKPKHALSGLITCGRCGSIYHRKSARDGLAWECSSYKKRKERDPKAVECPGKVCKMTHEEVILSQFMELCRILVIDMNQNTIKHYSPDFLKRMEDLQVRLEEDEPKELIKKYVRGIVIGTQTADRVIDFDIGDNVHLITKTKDNDTRYRQAELSIEIKIPVEISKNSQARDLDYIEPPEFLEELAKGKGPL